MTNHGKSPLGSHYDGENQLVSQVKKDNTQRLNYAYDYAHRRVAKVVRSGSTLAAPITKTLRFVHQGYSIVAELDGSTYAVVRSYTWGLDLTGTVGGGGGVGGLLQIHDADSRYQPLYNANGNVRGLITADAIPGYAAGAVVAAYDYTVFGELTATIGTAAIAQANPIRFASKYLDAETGLYDYNHRFYDPVQGRFINRDPIGEMGGLNLYRYAGNRGSDRWDWLGFDSNDGWSLKDGVWYAPPFEVKETYSDPFSNIWEGAGSGSGSGASGGGSGSDGVITLDPLEVVGDPLPGVDRPKRPRPSGGGFAAPNKSPCAQLAAQRDKLRAQLGASNSVITRANGDLIGATNGAVEGSTLDQVNQFAERIDASSQGMDVILTAACEMNLRTVGRAVDHFSSGFSSITIGAGFGFGVSDIQNGDYMDGASQIIGSGIGTASLIGGRLAADGVISKAAGSAVRVGGLAAAGAQVGLFFGQELYAGVSHRNSLNMQQRTIDRFQARVDQQLNQLKDVYGQMKANGCN